MTLQASFCAPIVRFHSTHSRGNLEKMGPSKRQQCLRSPRNTRCRVEAASHSPADWPNRILFTERFLLLLWLALAQCRAHRSLIVATFGVRLFPQICLCLSQGFALQSVQSHNIGEIRQSTTKYRDTRASHTILCQVACTHHINSGV